MAEICKDVILETDTEKYYVHVNNKKELVFQNIKNNKLCPELEIIMSFCSDFDAVMDKTGKIHIVGCGQGGELVYFQKAGQRWAKGKLLEETKAENVFLFQVCDNLMAFFEENGSIKCLDFSDIQGGAFEIDKMGEEKEYFVTRSEGDNFHIFYTKAEGEVFGFKKILAERGVCENFEEISKECAVKNIFALNLKDEIFLSYKADDAIKFEKTGDKLSRESLTRRHNKEAECPVLTRTQDGIKLCWLDDRCVFSSIRTFNEKKWQRLERESFRDFDRLNIFKICCGADDENEYVLGGLKNNEVVIWGRSDSVNENNREKPKGNFENKHIFAKLCGIEKILEEINKKIEKISSK